MGPEMSVLTSASASSLDSGHQKELYPNSWYDGNLQANGDDLRLGAPPCHFSRPSARRRTPAKP